MSWFCSLVKYAFFLFSYVASTGVLLKFLVNRSFNIFSILSSLSMTSCLNSGLSPIYQYKEKTFILKLFIIKVFSLGAILCSTNYVSVSTTPISCSTHTKDKSHRGSSAPSSKSGIIALSLNSSFNPLNTNQCSNNDIIFYVLIVLITPIVKTVNVKEYEFKQSKYEITPRLPFSQLIVGPSGSGKGMILQTMVLDIYRDVFARIYIWSPSISVDSNWTPVENIFEKMLVWKTKNVCLTNTSLGIRRSYK